MNCLQCRYCNKRRECDYDFRWASGGAGQSVDNIRDVYRCLDYAEANEDEEFDGEGDEDK